tara:strand:- start:2227 stop:2616 length:390 start_codon:yes stop_codon:yes gene_type:complete
VCDLGLITVKSLKYKAKKVKLDGYTFDSQAEAKHYWHTLKPKLERGEITHLEVHPSYEIVIDGEKICKYMADFRYFTGKKRIVEDVKGFKTPVYRLKKKLVEATYRGTKILEISPKQYQSGKWSLPSQE